MIYALIAAGLFVLYLISIYNRLVRFRNNRKNAFADIDVQLKQRHDLIPQLMNTVKGYMDHESSVLTKITAARSQAMNANSIDDKIAAEGMLSSALGGLKIAVEAYPDLKANTNFLQFQEEISDIENKLAAARRYFNSATTEYNNQVQSFPANIVSNMFGFKEEILFEISASERADHEKAPDINFGK
jgi:LemA protein